MKKHSCGAILYTISNNNVYVVLGMEKGQWFPFKGTREKGETNNQAAIREIKEETCNAVHIKHIELKCNYSTKRKHYHIGLTRITSEEFNLFYHNKHIMLHEYNPKGTPLEYNWAYVEKEDIKMFPLDNIMSNNFHEITKIPIKYYYHYLSKLQRDVRRKLRRNKPNLTKISKSRNFSQISPQWISKTSSNIDHVPMTLV
jgi:ADP-ribose pyrophosphatase YjhB (NUDIX family)